MRKQEAEHRFAFAQRFFAAAAFDGERDMAADGFQKFEVALVVSVFILVVLNHQDADRFGWRSKGNTEPCGRGRTDEFNFAFGGEAVEFFLGNQLRLSRSKDIRHAGARNFLRGRRRIKLVDEKREMKHVRGGFMQGDETVFGVHHFCQGLVNLAQKLVEIGSLVQRVDDVGNDLAFGFEAAEIGNVTIGNEPAFDSGRL